MKEKPYYFPFNDYVKLFEEITGCKINTRQDIVKKRLERFLKHYNIHPDNVFKVEEIIENDRDCLNSFIDIFIPVESFFFRERDYLFLTIALAKKYSLKNVLVAPCANGESVYSLKIISIENNIDLSIHGMDISDRAISKAMEGVYENYSVTNIPKKLLEKHFELNENRYRVKDYLKKGTLFLKANMVNQMYNCKYDIILCRNFLIYLEEETIELILKNIGYMLKKGGFLILSKSELSLIKRNSSFLKEKEGNLIYFRKIKWKNC